MCAVAPSFLAKLIVIGRTRLKATPAGGYRLSYSTIFTLNSYARAIIGNDVILDDTDITLAYQHKNNTLTMNVAAG